MGTGSGRAPPEPTTPPVAPPPAVPPSMSKPPAPESAPPELGADPPLPSESVAGGGDLHPPEVASTPTIVAAVLRSDILVDSVVEAQCFDRIRRGRVVPPLSLRATQEATPVEALIRGRGGSRRHGAIEPIGRSWSLFAVADVIRAASSWRVAAVGHGRLSCAAHRQRLATGIELLVLGVAGVVGQPPPGARPRGAAESAASP